MSRETIHQAVRTALEEMGCSVTVDLGRRHPQIRWTDPVSGTRGIVTVPATSSCRRALLNNVRMVQRMVRLGRS